MKVGWRSRILAVAPAIAMLLGLVGILAIEVQAQEDHRIEILTGRVEQREIMVYALPDLSQGNALYIYATTLSGNLDPFLGIAQADVNVETLRVEFNTAVQSAIDEGRDPTDVVPQFASSVFLAWDDDGGADYDAALEWPTAASGNYRLLLFSSPLNRDSAGEYRITIGINAPEVLTGQAEPTNDRIAILDREASGILRSVEEATGTLTTEKMSTFFDLRDLDAGDNLFIFVEAISDDLRPIVELRDYGDKLLAMGNAGGEETKAALQYGFSEASRDNRVIVSAGIGDGTPTSGDFRLLLGINAPEVLDGVAEPVGRSIIRRPIEISVGIRLEQIVAIDLRAQTIEVVASIQTDWTDHRLAFRPDECDCRVLVLRGDAYTDYVAANADIWPEFTVSNQEGRRFAQNQYALVRSNGQATYFERFSAVIHDTQMDFREYPFDSQEFSIDIDSLFGEEFYVYTANDDFSEVGLALGEEEWVVTGLRTEVSSSPDFGSRFSFIIPAERHLDYYILRVFTPLGLIIAVSWATFFLRDYALRVSLAGANLLLFVAFNFTLGSDLPKLGYLTFLDAIVMTIFAVTAAVIIYNVALRTWERAGKERRALTIDRIAAAVYVAIYLAAFGAISAVFLA